MLYYTIRKLNAMPNGVTEIVLGAHLKPECDLRRLVVRDNVTTHEVTAMVAYPCGTCGWAGTCGTPSGEDCHT